MLTVISLMISLVSLGVALRLWYKNRVFQKRLGEYLLANNALVLHTEQRIKQLEATQQSTINHAI